MVGAQSLKRLVWVAGSKRDLMAMPDEVQDVFGYALYLAQSGSRPSRYAGRGRLRCWRWLRTGRETRIALCIP